MTGLRLREGLSLGHLAEQSGGVRARLEEEHKGRLEERQHAADRVEAVHDELSDAAQRQGDEYRRSIELLQKDLSEALAAPASSGPTSSSAAVSSEVVAELRRELAEARAQNDTTSARLAAAERKAESVADVESVLAVTREEVRPLRASAAACMLIRLPLLTGCGAPPLAC